MAVILATLTFWCQAYLLAVDALFQIWLEEEVNQQSNQAESYLLASAVLVYFAEAKAGPTAASIKPVICSSCL